MPIFVCRRCGQRLTCEVSLTPLPLPVAEAAHGSGQFLPPRMASGTYAQEAEHGLVLNPDDVVGTRPHPDPRRTNGCCRLDGLDGPNLVCAGCGVEVAVQQSDCWTQQQVTLLTDAARPARR